MEEREREGSPGGAMRGGLQDQILGCYAVSSALFLTVTAPKSDCDPIIIHGMASRSISILKTDADPCQNPQHIICSSKVFSP